jgi:hypothetical protein
MNSGAFTRVSTTAGAGAPNGGSADPSISADGRHVAFTSLATNLVAGEPPGFDIFVKDLVTGELEWINRDSNGGAANADAQHAVISATGRYVVYESAATDLVAGDVDDGGTQLFWFDRVGGDTRRVSESADGDPANGFVLNADVSADGRFVVFESTANNLASGDDAGTRSDVFVKDMLTGDIAFVNRDDTGLDLTGTGNAFTGRQRPDISDDGQYVTFDGSGDVFFALNPLFPAPDLRDPDLIA